MRAFNRLGLFIVAFVLFSFFHEPKESFASEETPQKICFIKPKKIVTPEQIQNSRIKSFLGDKVFKKALALFEKEYENHTGTGIIIQVLDIPNFYEQYETTEKDYLSNVALENHSSMLMFAIIEFYMEDKLFDVTMYAYSPKVNVSPAIQIPPIAFEHLDMLQEIYQQTIFDLLNEFEPIKRN